MSATTIAPPVDDITSLIPKKAPRSRPLLDPPIVKRALADSFRKLNPRTMMKNPVMFVVEAGAAMVTWLAIQDRSIFGMQIAISQEPVLLDTGGGLKKAAYFFADKSNSDEPFILHNVDVISTIDLERVLQSHSKNRALATLAVQDRETSRYLLFDQEQQLCGRRAGREGRFELVRVCAEPYALAFAGIHVISPRLLTKMTEEGVFSIINTYLRLAGQGEKIAGFRADEYYWRDLGKPENVSQATQDFKDKILVQ